MKVRRLKKIAMGIRRPEQVVTVSEKPRNVITRTRHLEKIVIEVKKPKLGETIIGIGELRARKPKTKRPKNVAIGVKKIIVVAHFIFMTNFFC